VRFADQTAGLFMCLACAFVTSEIIVSLATPSTAPLPPAFDQELAASNSRRCLSSGRNGRQAHAAKYLCPGTCSPAQSLGPTGGKHRAATRPLLPRCHSCESNANAMFTSLHVHTVLDDAFHRAAHWFLDVQVDDRSGMHVSLTSE
jgi:hypothetical protein